MYLHVFNAFKTIKQKHNSVLVYNKQGVKIGIVNPSPLMYMFQLLCSWMFEGHMETHSQESLTHALLLLCSQFRHTVPATKAKLLCL